MRKKSHFCIGIFIFCAAAAVLWAIYVPLRGAGGMKQTDSIKAKAFPNGPELVLKIRAWVPNGDDPDAYPGNLFFSKTTMKGLESICRSAEGVFSVRRYELVQSSGFSLLIKTVSEKNGTGWFSIRQIGETGGKTRYILSASVAVLNDQREAGSNDRKKILFPIHLVPDNRLFESTENRIVPGAEYECSPVEESGSGKAEKPIDLFREFYEKSGYYSVQPDGENCLRIQPEDSRVGEISFYLVFLKHGVQEYWKLIPVNK